MIELIQQEVKKLTHLLLQIQHDTTLLAMVEKIASSCTRALQAGKKILFAGNGGSAADSQHLAAELICRLRYSRPALPAIALTTDTSVLTAAGNDVSFDTIFSRQVEGLGQEGDVFIGISTSGKSPNILQALKAAREKKLVTVGFTGREAPLMSSFCDLLLTIPSTETPKIQECHILFGHIVCGLIEDTLFGKQYDPKRQHTAEVA